MTTPPKKALRALKVERPGKGDHDVGYGKPPKHTRFKPGQSGNPRGRPKGAKNKVPALHEERLKAIILEEAYRTIKVRDGGRDVTVPIAQAVVRSLAVNAAKGNTRAQQLFAQLLITTETANKQLHDEWVETVINYKVEWEREFQRLKKLGMELPDLDLHPDQIEADMRSGQVYLHGPLNKEERARIERLYQRKADFEEELICLRRELEDNPEHEFRKHIEADIEYTERLLAMVTTVCPDRDGDASKS